MYFLSGPVTVPITFMVRPGCIVIRPRVPGGKRNFRGSQVSVSCCKFLLSLQTLYFLGVNMTPQQFQKFVFSLR